MRVPDDWKQQHVAVLLSGGLDSAILLAELAETAPQVTPIYVQFGLLWEGEERQGIDRFLAALDPRVVQPLKTFSLAANNVYGAHWSTTGIGTPDHTSADSAVFLPGRNLLLLGQACIWCSLRGIPTIALAPLAGNPFADSSEEFFQTVQSAVKLSVGKAPRIIAPYRNLSKREVMLKGASFPLQLTFSCIRPSNGHHCGECNKCAERRSAFRDAVLQDPTRYACVPGQDEEPYVSCHT